MATYTDNYQLTKPTYAEQADIGVINSNMNKIDDVMHSSQISLAPAYDQTQTYAEGDVVMYELLMYKCISPTTGVWDASKWERTTASESGGGGSAELDILGEASGAVASFADGASAGLAKCIAEIVPTQDLHGYDKPWAGGAGKNKYIGSPSFDGYANISTYQVSGETYQGHAVIYKSTAWKGAYKANLPLTAGVTYTFSAMVKTSTTANVNIYMETSTLVATVEVGTTWQRVSAQITPSTDISDARIRIESVTGDITIYLSEYQIEEGSEATAYEPYSNICPISGHSSITINVSPTSDPAQGVDTTIQLGDTYYGGTLNVGKGELAVTYGYIASYNGETLTGEWLSDRDEYTIGGTPTTGAEVVYELATPITVQLTPTVINTLLGQNYISSDDTGDIDIVYVKASAPIQPNPTGEPTATLTKLGIEGTVFELEGGGGGSSVINYSTTEQRTGQKWIDGKDIYVRAFDYIIESSTTTILANCGFETLVKIEGSVKYSDSGDYVLPLPYSDLSDYVLLRIHNGDFIIVSSAYFVNKRVSGTVVAYYTKITD